MPHINLLYPFVLDEFFAEAADELTRALASFQVSVYPLYPPSASLCLLSLIIVGVDQPFKLRFEGFREFHHAKSNTLWLEPQTEVTKKLIMCAARRGRG
jgi:hypothetical protein